MISLTDCTDLCDVTCDELEAIELGAHVSPIEACALARDADNPQPCRKLLKYMQTYLEYVESHDTSGGRQSHAVHESINHFVSEHHFI
ncbi:MAG: hypothetical protein R3E95_00845 [Thiolinea sp.]